MSCEVGLKKVPQLSAMTHEKIKCVIVKWLGLAPDGCLQYLTTQTGTVKSFNYNNMAQLNNQDYTVCVKPQLGMRRITVRLVLFCLPPSIFTHEHERLVFGDFSGSRATRTPR